ncbi:ABC transporter permease [Dactylosporangium fulvum]|uniref:ABC transporter permease n=1 Tax=Dactylosporangium fulvum TaxID=53359 RepID=A0ABY5VWQ5_9ACTN|nr:ABC transporter permease [Dactylosporangium fulvum]UWP80216.1 ABC transporter permease [Dactylosporangium fulvum]
MTTQPDVSKVPAPGSAELTAKENAGSGSRRARRRGLGVLFWCSAAWLGLVVLGAIVAPLLPIADPAAQDYRSVAVAPGSPGHLLGTDGLGRDLLARAVFGARISLIITLGAVTIGLVVGGTLGMLAGYFRGTTERLIVAATDAMMAVPALVLLLALMATLGSSVQNLIVGLGLLGVPAFVRLTRANTLVYTKREFIVAARSLGASNRRILAREIVPNILPAVAAYAFLVVGILIIAEGSLSFLGVGVPPPASSWGMMIAEGRDSLRQAPWVSFIPSAFMFLTVLSFNLIGDRLREESDVRETTI